MAIAVVDRNVQVDASDLTTYTFTVPLVGSYTGLIIEAGGRVGYGTSCSIKVDGVTATMGKQYAGTGFQHSAIAAIMKSGGTGNVTVEVTYNSAGVGCGICVTSTTGMLSASPYDTAQDADSPISLTGLDGPLGGISIATTTGAGASSTCTTTGASETYDSIIDSGVAMFFSGAARLHASQELNQTITMTWTGGSAHTGVACSYEASPTGATLTADTGSLSITGQSAAVAPARNLPADTGSLSISGQAAVTRYNRTLTADVGSLSISGVQAGLKPGYNLVAAQGTLAITGQAAGTLATRVLVADVGTLSITGINAGLAAGLKLTADPGAYAIGGIDADLYGGKRLRADVGTLAITGVAAATYAVRYLYPVAGSYAITGIDAVTRRSYLSLAASPGSLAISGIDARPAATRFLVSDAGSYSIEGKAALPYHSIFVFADPGSYAIGGGDATLSQARRRTNIFAQAF